MDKLNKIKPTIGFTYKLKTNNSILFLDILFMNNNNKLEFKVHHKFTHKNDHIHFDLHHNAKIKSGIITGFYLRVKINLS